MALRTKVFSMSTKTQTHARTDKRTVLAWALWDWGSAAFNAVLVTFIFAVYLTDSVGANVQEYVAESWPSFLRASSVTASGWYGYAMGIAGVFIALTAPVIGRRTDIRGTRKRSVTVWSIVAFFLMASLFFIRNDHIYYFWVALLIMGVASVIFQLAEVSYFAMLRQVSTPENVGRISGFGWSMGYFGGIFVLLICYLGFIQGDGPTRGFLGLSTEGGWNIRVVALFAAFWFIVSAIPLMVRVPEIEPDPTAQVGGIRDSYARLFREFKELWQEDRHAVYFLLASAVLRDGLAGVFTFGAILAVSSYGLSAGDVLLFGVAANVVSALGALGMGVVDDKIGPKPVIIFSLLAMVVVCLVIFFLDGPLNFWIFGLILTLFVGPAQSSCRSFLSRMTPEGRDGQMFGLYATTGRAVSWLAPIAFSVSVSVGGSDRAGIIGIAIILAAGAILLLPVRPPTLAAKQVSTTSATVGAKEKGPKEKP